MKHKRRILLAESDGDLARWYARRTDRALYPHTEFEMTIATPTDLARLDVRLPWWADAELILLTRTDAWQYRQPFVDKLAILRARFPEALADPSGLLPVIKPPTPAHLRDPRPVVKAGASRPMHHHRLPTSRS